MPHHIVLPIIEKAPLEFDIANGQVIFMLGANGTGKSSLVGRIFNQHSAQARRISAHRQTWFTSNTLDLTPNNRSSLETNIRNQDSQERSRYVQEYAAERTGVAIFDLLEQERLLDREIANLVRADDAAAAKVEAAKSSPLEVINNLMRLSNIPISISVEEGQKIMAHREGVEPYSIAELSDGERNAFLIAAEVLTAKPDTLILVDEPERHLHRSIITPLLSLLFSHRSDCAFIVSTHEVMLPVDNPSARTLLVRRCSYQGNTPTAWDIDLLPANAEVEDDLKREILGARRKILFVEGTNDSMDFPIYSLLFPQTSVIPKGGCRDVEQAVRGLRGSADTHWVNPWGIVDNDRRSASNIEKLAKNGVFALPHFSIESLYYHPEIVWLVCMSRVVGTEQSAEQIFDAAVKAACQAAGEKRGELILDALGRIVRETIFENLPSKDEVEARAPVSIQVDTAALATEEEERFDKFIAGSNLEELVRHYPLRTTQALHLIATTLGFESRSAYEDSVRMMVGAPDSKSKEFLIQLFGTLPQSLAE